MPVAGFEPAVRAGFESDDGRHRRNLLALAEYLRSKHVGPEQIAPGAVGTEQLADGAVTDAKVDNVGVSKLRSGTLTADVIVAAVLASAATAQRWVLDPNGFFLYDDNDDLLVALPSFSGSEPFFKGSLEATGLIVTGNLTIRGTNNLIEPGAAIVLGGAATGASVADPAAAPGVSVTWDGLNISDAAVKGLFYDSTNTSFWTTNGVNTIYEINATTGNQIRDETFSGFAQLYGVVRVGSSVYILGRLSAGGRVIRRLAESNLSFTSQQSIDTVAYGPRIGFGYDGTDLCVVDVTPGGSSGDLRWRRYSTGLVFQGTVTTNVSVSSFNRSNLEIGGLVKVGSDIWIAMSHWDPSYVLDGVQKFNTSGVRQADNEFYAPSGQDGVAHDGSNFWTCQGTKRLTKHSNWTWTTQSNRYWVAYTWVDDNGAVNAGTRPLAAGDYETKKSPTASVFMLRRARLQVTVPQKPSDATHAGVYMDRGSAEPTLDYMTDVAGLSTTFTDFTAGGAAPPASNNFPSGSNSEFRTSSGIPIIRSNGVPRCRVRRAASQSIADAGSGEIVNLDTNDADTDSMVNLTTDEITIPFSGQWEILLTANWAANATNRREIKIQRDSGGGFADQAALRSVVASSGGADITTCCIAQMQNLSAGDKLRVWAFQNSGGALNLTNLALAMIYEGPA